MCVFGCGETGSERLRGYGVAGVEREEEEFQEIGLVDEERLGGVEVSSGADNYGGV